MIDKVSPVPLYIQIQDMLYEQISSGQLESGSRVPSEPKLAAAYNVSRMTARKAIDGLVTKGFLVRRQGKGTYVAESVLQYHLSTMLSFSDTLRSRGYDVATTVLYQDVIPASSSVAERLHVTPYSQIVLIRRLRYLNGQPAAIHTAFLDHRTFAPILNIDLNTNSLLASIEQVSGIRVAYTKDSVQATLVSPEDMGLLNMAVGSPVLEVEGVAFTENGQPTRLSKAIYRSDLFKLIVTNTGNLGTSLRIADNSDDIM